jgi:hypothetical protein
MAASELAGALVIDPVDIRSVPQPLMPAARAMSIAAVEAIRTPARAAGVARPAGPPESDPWSTDPKTACP